MAKSNPKNTLKYWANLGAKEIAAAAFKSSNSFVEMFSKIRKAFSGMSMKIAAQFGVQARNEWINRLPIPSENDTKDDHHKGAKVDPSLFPDGNQGRRYKTWIKVQFRHEDSGDILHREFILEGSTAPSEEQILNAIELEKSRLLGGSPGGFGKDINIDEFYVYKYDVIRKRAF